MHNPETSTQVFELKRKSFLKTMNSIESPQIEKIESIIL